MKKISKEDLKKASKKTYELGKEVGTNRKKMEKTYSEAKYYFDRAKRFLEAVGGVNAMKSLLNIAKAVLDGKCIPSTKIIIAIMGTLAYFVLPMDVIPDFLVPILGFADDLAIARLTLALVQSETENCEKYILLAEERKEELEEFEESLNQVESELFKITKMLNEKDTYDELINILLDKKGGKA